MDIRPLLCAWAERASAVLATLPPGPAVAACAPSP